MWLRDSSNQVLTYQDFFGRDSDLQAMVKGVIRR
jgi:meiotically up-regulated gene 157 (Mug157) protein